MSFKENSLIAFYYKWMFCGRLPNNLCVFFWNSLLSILLLPLTFPYFLFSLISERRLWRNSGLFDKAAYGLLTYLGVFLAFCFGLGSFEKVFGPIWRLWGFWPVMGAAVLGLSGLILAFATFILAIVGICAGVFYSVEFIKNIFRKKVTIKTVSELGIEYVEHYYEPKVLKIVILWNAIRNKYCTKIEWKK